MTVRTKGYLKQQFASGQIPSGAKFADLIDSTLYQSVGGGVTTAFNGSHIATATSLTVDDSSGFIPSARVVYTTATGLEYNQINTVPNATTITVVSGLGDAVSDNEPLTQISESEYQAANAINFEATLPPTLDLAVSYLSHNLYNVEAYGADKTGATAAQTEINAAITECNSDGGGTVYLPEGTYKLTAAIVLKDNVVLAGAGMGRSILQRDAAYTAGQLINDGAALTDVVMRDLTLDQNSVVGQDILTLTQGIDGFYMYRVRGINLVSSAASTCMLDFVATTLLNKRIILDSCEFYELNGDEDVFKIRILNPYNCIVRSCIFDKTVTLDIETSSSALSDSRYIIVDGNQWDSSNTSNCLVRMGGSTLIENVTIVNNQFRECGQYAPLPKGAIVAGEQASGNNGVMRNLVIANNTILGVGRIAISVGGPAGVGNTVENVTVTGNTIKGRNFAGSLFSDDIHGIFIRETTSRFTVANNVIFDTSRTAITLADASQGTITGNVCELNCQDVTKASGVNKDGAIRIEPTSTGSQDITISGNMILNPGEGNAAADNAPGIAVSGGLMNRLYIHGNTIIDDRGTAFMSYGVAMGVLAADASGMPTNSRVYNNHIEGALLTPVAWIRHATNNYGYKNGEATLSGAVGTLSTDFLDKTDRTVTGTAVGDLSRLNIPGNTLQGIRKLVVTAAGSRTGAGAATLTFDCGTTVVLSANVAADWVVEAEIFPVSQTEQRVHARLWDNNAMLLTNYVATTDDDQNAYPVKVTVNVSGAGDTVTCHMFSCQSF